MRGTLPLQRGHRTNNALYTNSTLAIDPKTGKLKWYHQYLEDDTWDLDYVYERMLIDLPFNGQDTEDGGDDRQARHHRGARPDHRRMAVGEARPCRRTWSRRSTRRPARRRSTRRRSRISARPRSTVRPTPVAAAGRRPPTARRPQTLYLPLNEFCSNTTPKPLDPGQVYTGGGRAIFARVPVPGQRRQHRPGRRGQADRPVDALVVPAARAADQRDAADRRRRRVRRHLGPLVPRLRRRRPARCCGRSAPTTRSTRSRSATGQRQAVRGGLGRQRLERWPGRWRR